MDVKEQKIIITKIHNQILPKRKSIELIGQDIKSIKHKQYVYGWNECLEEMKRNMKKFNN
jgi:hypothetical protein